MYRWKTKEKNKTVALLCCMRYTALDGKVTANQYKVIPTDHLYPVMKRFYPDGRGLFQDDHRERGKGI